MLLYGLLVFSPPLPPRPALTHQQIIYQHRKVSLAETQTTNALAHQRDIEVTLP
jgi:hypothetical protein